MMYIVNLGQALTQVGSTFDLERAVRLNRQYAQSLGWQAHYDRIVQMLGFAFHTPGEHEFAEAVAAWQARQTDLTSDGILGPNSWKRLKAVLATSSPTPGGTPSSSTASGSKKSALYPEVNTLMPREGSGFYCRKSSERRYGLPETINALTAIGAAWHQEYPNGPRIIISDISKQGGGDLCFESGRCHKSHKTGLDVDIRPVQMGTGERHVTYKDATYSQSRTRDLINLILNNKVLPVKDIAFLDPAIAGPVIRRWPGHHDHLHVRFCAPDYFQPKVSSRYKGCAKQQS